MPPVNAQVVRFAEVFHKPVNRHVRSARKQIRFVNELCNTFCCLTMVGTLRQQPFMLGTGVERLAGKGIIHLPPGHPWTPDGGSLSQGAGLCGTQPWLDPIT